MLPLILAIELLSFYYIVSPQWSCVRQEKVASRYQTPGSEKVRCCSVWPMRCEEDRKTLTWNMSLSGLISDVLEKGKDWSNDHDYASWHAWGKGAQRTAHSAAQRFGTLKRTLIICLQLALRFWISFTCYKLYHLNKRYKNTLDSKLSSCW